MKLSPADKKVIDAFLDKTAGDSNKLTTDGMSLDGNWMGGRGIAVWEGGKIQFPDLGSKSAELIQNAIRRMAPRNWIGASVTEMEDVEPQAEKPIRERRHISEPGKEASMNAALYMQAIGGKFIDIFVAYPGVTTDLTTEKNYRILERIANSVARKVEAFARKNAIEGVYITDNPSFVTSHAYSGGNMFVPFRIGLAGQERGEDAAAVEDFLGTLGFRARPMDRTGKEASMKDSEIAESLLAIAESLVGNDHRQDRVRRRAGRFVKTYEVNNSGVSFRIVEQTSITHGGIDNLSGDANIIRFEAKKIGIQLGSAGYDVSIGDVQFSIQGGSLELAVYGVNERRLNEQELSGLTGLLEQMGFTEK